MPRKVTSGTPAAAKGSNSASANSSSLRAKAAANAAIQAHNSSVNSPSSSAHPGVNTRGSSGRRQRDPQFDTEALTGFLDDDEVEADLARDREAAFAEESRDDEEHGLFREGEHEARRAGDGNFEDEDADDAMHIIDDETARRLAEEEFGEHDEDDDDEDEGDDMDEDDEIVPAGEGEMLDDDFDAPLTFDADGNPLAPDAPGTGASEAAVGGEPSSLGSDYSHSSSGESSHRSNGEGGAAAGGLSSSSASALAAAAAAASSAGDDDFGSFAASLRGYSSLMAGMSSRLRTLLTNLRKTDTTERMVALQELSELLSMSTEDTLAGYFSVDSFVKELVSILKGGSPTSVAGGAEGDEDDEEMDEDLAMARALAASTGDSFGGAGAMDDGSQDEMQLLACRCLANLIEAMPTSSHNIVSNGAVPVLCSKLFEITFIDLAEQTISSLEKLSEEMPSSIVREGGLSALLTYLDFFSSHVQRTALTAVAHCCRSVSLDNFNAVRDAVPTLRNVLSYSDCKLVEQACLAITGIVDSYRHYPDKLEELLTGDLLTAIAALLVPGSANSTIDSTTHPKILRLLSTAAKSSPEIAISLIEMNVVNTLYVLLTGVSPPMESEGIQGIQKHLEMDDMLVLNNLVHRSKDVVQETLALVQELLPALPKDGIFDPRAHTGRSSRSKAKKEEQLRAQEDFLGTSPASGPAASLLALGTSEKSPASTTGASTPISNRSPARTGRSTPIIHDDGSVTVKREESATPAPPMPGSGWGSSTSNTASTIALQARTKEAMQQRRVELFAAKENQQRLDVVNRFCAMLLPVLLDVYSASVGVQVRQKTLQSMLKIVQYANIDHLPTILTIVPMASFLASCFSSRDQPTLTLDALQMTELLLTRVPDTYQFYFRREGVMHEIEKMAEEPLINTHKSRKEKEKPSTTTPPTSAVAGSTSLVDAIAEKALTSVESALKDAITYRARFIKKLLADSSSADGSQKANSALANIRSLVQILDDISDSEKTSTRDEAEMKAREALAKIAGLFGAKETMSSFEMQESGLIGGLLRFATGSHSSLLDSQSRRNLLMHAFMTGNAADDSALGSLVKRLQETLGKVEESEVVTALPSGGDSRQNPATMLARQLKIRLVAAEGSGIPRSCATLVVSIHAIATFQAFNDYLRPRIASALATQERSGAASPGPSAGARSSSGLQGVLAAFAQAAGLPSPDLESPLPSSSRSQPTTPTASSHPKPKQPERRRSSRLSAKANASGTSATTPATEDMKADPSSAPSTPMACNTATGDMEGEDGAEVLDEEDLRHDAEAATITEEGPVNFEVASDGTRVHASTPDGTRVQTPQPGSSLASTAFANAASTMRTRAAGGSDTPTASTPAASSSSGVAPGAPGRSYASALKTAPSDWHLDFSMDQHEVPTETTIFGAVYQHEVRTGSQQGARNLWHSVHTVTFRKIAGPPPTRSLQGSPEPPSFEAPLPAFLEKDVRQANVLRLLGVLHQINTDWQETLNKHDIQHLSSSPAIASNVFVNNKLTAKLNRQLEEPMIVASACLPDWAIELPQLFPFLFPFETRYTFLQSTSFGYARLMQKWLQSARSDTTASRRDENLSFLGRLQRQKVRISRQRLFESAFKVFELYGSSRAMLEVEYFDEVGTGLGPTLEFYSLVSKEFRKKSLDLWRDSDSHADSEFVHSAAGLFPAPVDDKLLDTEAGKRRLATFKVLGTLVAKALMDSRIIDIPFSKTFMKLVLNSQMPMTVASIKNVDPGLAKSLDHLARYVQAVTEIQNDGSIADKATALREVRVDDASIDDLSLDFTLPGYDIELKDGGRSVPVTLDNLQEYIDSIIRITLRDGVRPLAQKFKEGFSEVFPVYDLHTFTPDELVKLFGDEEEDWTYETISDNMKADHGYSLASVPVANFIKIISAFDHAMRRKALSFFTGASRLPIGGFGGLNPPLTLVRKLPEDGLTADSVLPSVMTCANFVKMPEYSSRDIMKERLVKAIEEGGGAFHLS